MRKPYNVRMLHQVVHKVTTVIQMCSSRTPTITNLRKVKINSQWTAKLTTVVSEQRATSSTRTRTQT